MKRAVLLIAALLVTGALAIAAFGRWSDARRAAPLDPWVVPSYHEIPGPDFSRVPAVEWIADSERAAAELALASDVAIPLDDAALAQFLPGPIPQGAPGCAQYLVRGMAYPGGGVSFNRVMTNGTTIDTSTYGGFGCQLASLERAPFVACLAQRPSTVLTSFRCEPLGVLGWLLHGSGDRW